MRAASAFSSSGSGLSVTAAASGSRKSIFATAGSIPTSRFSAPWEGGQSAVASSRGLASAARASAAGPPPTAPPGPPAEGRAALVHEVARLPAREELGVEAVQPFDLEEGVGEQQPAAGKTLERPCGAWISRAKAAKLSDASSTPRARSSSSPRATRNSIRPFGVSRSRRISESETGPPSVARREVQEAASAPVRVSAQHARGCRAWSSRRSSSSDIAKPRSPAPRRQLPLTASSSASSASQSCAELERAPP